MRKRIGVIVNYLYEGYQMKVLSGIFSFAEKLDVNILTFVGGNLNPEPENIQRNQIYKLISEEVIDGLIIMGLVIGYDIPKENIINFYNSFSNRIPIVSIGLSIKNIPSVITDNRGGFKNLLIHLIEDHKYKNFAFVTGPLNNEDARERYETFLEIMDQYNIKIEPNYIYKGDFSKPSGINAIKTFLDERKIKPQVIVFSNDAMAISAIEELKRRGIKIPEDIAITGFDNIEESMLISPSLTTVSQGLYDLGQKALEVCYALISGEKIDERIILPTRVIIRESCGHKSLFIDKYKNMLVSSQNLSKFKEIKNLKDKFKDFVKNILGNNSEKENEFIDLLYNSFLQELFYKKENFIKFMEKNIEISNLEKFKELLNLLYIFLSSHLSKRLLNKAEYIISKAMFLINNFQEKFIKYEIIKNNEEGELLGYIGTDLISSFNMQDIINRITYRIPELGINTFYIIFYDKNTSSLNANLVIGYNDGKTYYKRLNFPLKELIPKEILPERRYTFIINPLYFQENQFGYAIFEYGPKRGIVYEILRSQISSAIEGAILFEEINKLAVTDPLTELPNRRAIEDSFQKEILRSQRYKRPLSVMVLDLDNFKVINDTYGHKFGDEVLRKIGQVLKNSIRKTDIIGRYGGDEFVIILPETNLVNSIKVAKKIIKNIENTQIFTPDGKITYLGISIGIASYPENIKEPEKLLSTADFSMYNAKKLGGGIYIEGSYHNGLKE